MPLPLSAFEGFSGPNHVPAPTMHRDTPETRPQDTPAARHIRVSPWLYPSGSDSMCPNAADSRRDAFSRARVRQEEKGPFQVAQEEDCIDGAACNLHMTDLSPTRCNQRPMEIWGRAHRYRCAAFLLSISIQRSSSSSSSIPWRIHSTTASQSTGSNEWSGTLVKRIMAS